MTHLHDKTKNHFCSSTHEPLPHVENKTEENVMIYCSAKTKYRKRISLSSMGRAQMTYVRLQTLFCGLFCSSEASHVCRKRYPQGQPHPRCINSGMDDGVETMDVLDFVKIKCSLRFGWSKAVLKRSTRGKSDNQIIAETWSFPDRTAGPWFPLCCLRGCQCSISPSNA